MTQRKPQITRLSNGLRVATVEMPHMASVSLGAWVGIGARYEPARLNGACHFIEHMLFKGTARRSARQISQAVEGIGGDLNAFTSEEMTCFHSKARADRFDELLDVLTDMFLRSRFAPAELAKERDVIKEEVAMYRDQPQLYVQELLNATLWPHHPLGRPITGTEETLDGLTRTELLGWLRQRYVAENTVIVAAGHLNHRQVVKAVSQYAPLFNRGTPSSFDAAEILQGQPRLNHCTRKTEQTQIALGIRACSRHDERRYALRLLNVILGENMSSRLFQIVREDRGLAYSIYSTPSFWSDTGDIVISAGLNAENLPKTLKLVMRELRRLADKAPTAAELRRARDYAIGQIDLGLESTDNQMNWLGEQILGYGKVLGPAGIKRRLTAVTAAEIRKAASDFFRPERMNLALVTPRKSAAGLAQLLAG